MFILVLCALIIVLCFFYFFFFFQAEDGIRDLTVTGVQTCALPISNRRSSLELNFFDDKIPCFAAPLGAFFFQPRQSSIDRKSTRLNSSHSQISYAVFCLKKKKRTLHDKTTYVI